MRKLIFFAGNLQHFTFVGMESHIPLVFPLSKGVKITLERHLVFCGCYIFLLTAVSSATLKQLEKHSLHHGSEIVQVFIQRPLPGIELLPSLRHNRSMCLFIITRFVLGISEKKLSLAKIVHQGYLRKFWYMRIHF